MKYKITCEKTEIGSKDNYLVYYTVNDGYIQEAIYKYIRTYDIKICYFNIKDEHIKLKVDCTHKQANELMYFLIRYHSYQLKNFKLKSVLL